MCSNGCNITELEKQAALLKVKRRNCKKCESQDVFVLIQKEHCYCKQCFHEYSSHKLRSTIGKTRLVKKDDKVLVAVSGGLSSMAMLAMIEEGLSLENHHRRLQFVPIILFVDESSVLSNEMECKQMQQFLASKIFESHVVRLEKVFRSEGDQKLLEGTAEVVPEEVTQLQSTMETLTEDTSREQFIRTTRNQLIIDCARELGCDSIFIGASGSRLAVQLITDIAQGRGSAVNQEIGFLDNRSDIPVLKPMREFVVKEVAYFSRLKNLHPIVVTDLLTKSNVKASIGKVTECFINTLEKDFPATTYSLCRISTKVKSKNDHKDIKCLLCNTPTDISIDQVREEKSSSALAALRVSNKLCREEGDEGGNSLPRIPLCYSCSQLLS
jgi:cytoplasmic tRNA 2-thiolation protein 2